MIVIMTTMTGQYHEPRKISARITCKPSNNVHVFHSFIKEEARRWEARAAHAFKSSYYSFCVDYVNLALKYTPADSKQTFSLLLCQRSQAVQQLGDYEKGLEDAKDASKMNPGLLEVII